MPGRGGPTKNFYLPLARQHVRSASRWIHEVGTDYWYHPAGGSIMDPLAAASTATGDELAENGWTATSLVNTVGSGGDLLSSSDPGDANHILTNASGDLLVCSPIFGTYGHGLMASKLVGKNTVPTSLNLEAYAAFSVASADEPTSGFGFFEDATTTTSATEALQTAFISSNGANFELNTNASTTLTSVGAAIDTNWHLWRITMKYNTSGVATAYWYIDDVLQGSLPPTTDEAPYAFGLHSLTTNRLKMSWFHIYYDW